MVIHVPPLGILVLGLCELIGTNMQPSIGCFSRSSQNPEGIPV